VVHRFVAAAGNSETVMWHYVEARDPSAPTVAIHQPGKRHRSCARQRTPAVRDCAVQPAARWRSQHYRFRHTYP
jgi:hypothetical protein